MLNRLFPHSSCLLLTIVFNCSLCHSQLEKVIVEKYYVCDAADASDTTGGGIEEGSVTYRLYIDMLPGTVLKKIYGDAEHPFLISSDEVFFNNKADGQTFAKEFIKGRYLENTVALDTWLTLGQTVKKQGDITYHGVLKQADDDGSFIGGINNDGGSMAIPTGLLVNEDPSCGLPLIIADGMDTLNQTPNNWFSNDVLDFLSGEDSTIFGSIVQGNQYSSENFFLSCSGVSGVIPENNEVIIAQLTTKGSLAFRINLEVEYMVNGILSSIFYVGTNNVTAPNEIYNPYLSYPYECGCNNPAYIEYNPSYICYAEGSCLTPVVIGCMDNLACNYDPSANFNIEELCCYPGWCNNRNIEEVCPQLQGNAFSFTIYPNPTSSNITLNVISGIETSIEYFVINSYGVVLNHASIPDALLNYSTELDLSAITPGIYQLKVITESGEQHKLFVRL